MFDCKAFIVMGLLSCSGLKTEENNEEAMVACKENRRALALQPPL